MGLTDVADSGMVVWVPVMVEDVSLYCVNWGGTEVPAALDGCVQYRGHLREGFHPPQGNRHEAHCTGRTVFIICLGTIHHVMNSRNCTCRYVSWEQDCGEPQISISLVPNKNWRDHQKGWPLYPNKCCMGRVWNPNVSSSRPKFACHCSRYFNTYSIVHYPCVSLSLSLPLSLAHMHLRLHIVPDLKCHEVAHH
jgi:hypothetical protein